jgi:hypothetical protein
MKVLLLSVSLVGLGVLVLWLYAARLPETVTTERVATVRAPVSEVFALVTDVAGQARWRRDVAGVDMVIPQQQWIETSRQGGTIRFEVVDQELGRLYAIRYASSFGFSGNWVGRFEAVDGTATRLRITETVTVPSVPGRLFARMFSPPGSHIDLYLEDLRQALGEPGEAKVASP